MIYWQIEVQWASWNKGWVQQMGKLTCVYMPIHKNANTTTTANAELESGLQELKKKEK